MQENEENKLSDLATRFLASMEYVGTTGYKLRQNGIINNEATLTKIKKGIQQPSRKMLDKYLEHFKQINPVWLLLGDGEPMTSLPPQAMEGNAVPGRVSSKANELYLETKSGMKYYELGENQYKMRVPFVPYNAYARYICDSSDIMEQDRESWEEIDFIVDKIGHGNYMAFEIKGDSMDDDSKRSFSHGDKVLVRELDRIHWRDGIRYNQYPYWVIVFSHSILCKQIINHDMENNTITCHSLNPSPEYTDFTVNLDEVYRLFNVVQKVPAAINY